MYILDTDHLTILQRGGQTAENLRTRLATLDLNEQVVTTIITYEEQTRGWLSYLTKTRSVSQQVIAYNELQKHLNHYLSIPVIGFDHESFLEFQKLRKIYKRLGTMDLKITAIARVNQATLLSRNLSDFEKISDLKVEDWTI
jgi:tRNA(fMet)-specific endonuclease VapC